MDCRNCSAPMEPAGQPVYVHCLYCGSYYSLSALPDGITPLGEAQDDLNCPVCQVPLLLVSTHARYSAHQCRWERRASRSTRTCARAIL